MLLSKCFPKVLAMSHTELLHVYVHVYTISHLVQAAKDLQSRLKEKPLSP